MKTKARPSEHESLLKARQKLARALASSDREWWNPTLKRKVEEARKAVARAQRRLEMEGGQLKMALEEAEEAHAPDAFRT